MALNRLTHTPVHCPNNYIYETRCLSQDKSRSTGLMLNCDRP